MELMRTRRRFTLIALGSQEEVENQTSIFFCNKIVFKANSECTSLQSQQANGAVETETLLEHTGEDKDANQDDSNLVNVNANMEKKARNVRHEDREEILRTSKLLNAGSFAGVPKMESNEDEKANKFSN